jgi:hypothetical protein
VRELDRKLPPRKARWALDNELAEPISEKLAQELTGDESTQAVKERVGVLVREHLRQLRKAR